MRAVRLTCDPVKARAFSTGSLEWEHRANVDADSQRDLVGHLERPQVDRRDRMLQIQGALGGQHGVGKHDVEGIPPGIPVLDRVLVPFEHGREGAHDLPEDQRDLLVGEL